MEIRHRWLMITCCGWSLLAACGQTSLGSGKEPAPANPASGGAPSPGTGGSIAGAQEQTGAHAGSPGESGAAGGGGVTFQDPRFVVIEPLPIPDQTPFGLVEPGDTAYSGTAGELVSDDGNVVVGTSTYFFKRNGTQVAQGAQPFYWTVRSGTTALVNTEDYDPVIPVCLGQEGESLIARPQYLPGLLSWSPNGVNAAPESWETVSCAAAGSVVFGLLQDGGLARWVSGENVTLGAPSPANSEPRLLGTSDDGSVGLLLRSGNAGQLVLLDETLSETTLPRPAGREQCTIKEAMLSLDGSVVVAYCQGPGASGNLYRWAEGTGAVSLLDGAIDDYRISPDASTVAGVLGDTSTLFHWTQASGLTLDDTLAPLNARLIVGRVTENGTVLTAVNTYGSDGQPAAQVATYVKATGFKLREHSADAKSSKIDELCALSRGNCGISLDGGVIVGDSGNNGEPGNAVVWDAQGARTVASVLQAIGVDLGDLQLTRASHVWADATTVRVLGSGELPNGDWRAWIAEIPRRD